MKGWLDKLENGGLKSKQLELLNTIRELPSTGTRFLTDTGLSSDATPKKIIGEDKPELKFMRNATITDKALKEITKISRKYPNVNPNQIAAAMAIENYGEIDAGYYQNTHTLYDKIKKDLGIPDVHMTEKQYKENESRMTDPIMFTTTEQAKPIQDSIEYTNLAKELGVFQPNGTINEEALLFRFNKKILPKIEQYKKEYKPSDSFVEDLFKYYDRYGIEQMNPGQKAGRMNKDTGLQFKADYPTMIREAADYIETKKLFNWEKPQDINYERFKNLNNSRNPKEFEDGGTLQKIAGYHPVIAGAKKLMSNFAENTNAFEYDDALGRIGKNAILNQKSRRRIEDEKNPDEAFKERADLLNLLANKEQQYNSIPQSKYKPTKGKNANYLSSPLTEKQIQTYVDDNWNRKNISSKEDLPKMRSKSLGNMTLDYGKDNQGSYISYYDKWDLNPIPQTGINWLDKTVDKVVTGVPNALGITNTPEVYGRVYLPEKKNGGELKKLDDLVNWTNYNKYI